MLKIGIIGSGFGLYGLLPAFNSIKNCRVTCICGEKTDRLVKYCQSINLENIYSDWKSMIGNEDLDALALAVTPDAQYEIAKAAMKKNINIFAEKPLAADLKQAKELFNLARKKKIINTIDFIFPEIEEWQKVKQILDQKTYGKLKYISVNWDFLSFDLKNKLFSWKTDVKKGGGALSFYFSHALYYLEYYAGEVLNVKSVFSHSKESMNGGEVGVDLLLKFKNGVIGNARICSNDKGLNRHQMILRCEKATIILENKDAVVENFTINIYDGKNIKQLFVKKNKVAVKNEDERVRIVRKIAERFVMGCIGKKQVHPSFREGLNVQELIEKIRLNKI